MTNSYKKNGYTWDVIKETDYKAIATNGTHWEVFYWQYNPERVIAGIPIAASITPPGNEQWGTQGWTFMSFNKALVFYTELKPKEVTNAY